MGQSGMIEEYVGHMVGFITAHINRPDGWKTMYELLRDHGVRYKAPATPRPKGMRKFRDKECFRTSVNLSIDMGWTYVEGFAVPKDIPIPIHHAWILIDGEVVEPTWSDAGVEYFGIPFKREYLMKCLLESEMYCVLDNYKWRDVGFHDPDDFLFKESEDERV